VKYNSYIASLKLLCTKSCKSAYCPAPLTYYSPTIYPSAAPLKNISYTTKKPTPPAVLRVSQVPLLSYLLSHNFPLTYESLPHALMFHLDRKFQGSTQRRLTQVRALKGLLSAQSPKSLKLKESLSEYSR
jgi:hypothetical protein